MKILTYGVIATALVIGTYGSVANAGEYRDHRDNGHKVERNYKQDRGRVVRADRRDQRYGHEHKYRQKYGHVPYRGNGPRAHWKWYKQHRYMDRHVRHYHGPQRVVVTRHYHHGSAAPVIAGSIIGGVIGSEVSGGDRGAAAVGAVLGAVIAADVASHRHDKVTVIRRHHR